MEPLQGERTCIRVFAYNLRLKAIESISKSAQISQSWPNWLSCLPGGFYGLQSRISNKRYSEPLMHALSPCQSPVESFLNSIWIPLGVLWTSAQNEISTEEITPTKRYQSALLYLSSPNPNHSVFEVTWVVEFRIEAGEIQIILEESCDILGQNHQKWTQFLRQTSLKMIRIQAWAKFLKNSFK